MEDLVSIVMPNYNCVKYIDETIQSVRKQSYTNWELLVVDDCSSDGSQAVVERYAIIDPRIKLFRNESNKGAAACRNIAIKNANGKWVAFLDSDDKWLPEKLEKQIRFMKNHRYHFSYTNYTEIDDQSNALGILFTGPKSISRFRMLQFNFAGCLTVMYDREQFKDLAVNPLLKCRNDYALWIKLSKKMTCYLLDETLAEYRVRRRSLSHSGVFRLVKNHYLLFRLSEKYGPILSVALTIRNMFWYLLKRVLYVKKIKQTVV